MQGHGSGTAQLNGGKPAGFVLLGLWKSHVFFFFSLSLRECSDQGYLSEFQWKKHEVELMLMS